MDLVEIINCLLEHGFLNQEDEEKPFCIDKLDHGDYLTDLLDVEPYEYDDDD